MTDYAELIAEAREFADRGNGMNWQGRVRELAGALEGAANRIEFLELQDAGLRDDIGNLERERDALAAMVEKVHMIEKVQDAMTAVQGIPAASPAVGDLVSIYPVQAWDEGHAAGLWAVQFRERAKDNPYREGSE